MNAYGYALDFSPPMFGLDARQWNTFRLGRVWTERLNLGDRVYLLNKRIMHVFGAAIVEGLHVGPLIDMAREHARFNHNQLIRRKGVLRSRSSVRIAKEQLMENMRRRYGLHIATDSKLCTVIYLRRL